MAARQRVTAHEAYWAETDDGERVRCLTAAAAWSTLINLGKPGKIVCENKIDRSLPDTWVVAIRHPDGTWLPMPSPIPVED
jgi:hypothetical protein